MEEILDARREGVARGGNLGGGKFSREKFKNLKTKTPISEGIHFGRSCALFPNTPPLWHHFLPLLGDGVPVFALFWHLASHHLFLGYANIY
jgi:hypothetical protein